jgi:hypothetical protein
MPFTGSTFRGPRATRYYVCLVLIFIRGCADLTPRVEIQCLGPAQGPGPRLSSSGRLEAFSVSTEGGSERGRAALGSRRTASRLPGGARSRSPNHPHKNTLRRAIGQQSSPIGLLRASRYALDGWPRPWWAAVFRSRVWTSKSGFVRVACRPALFMVDAPPQARRQDPRHFPALRPLSRWAFRLDPVLAVGRWSV